MPLVNVVGELGVGKTLSLTYLLFRNWFFKGNKIYSNYHLFKIPYIYINDIRQLDTIKDGYCGLDELWLFADSRMSKTQKNTFIANILGKSRKRGLTYASTAQVADSIEGRIRKVLDFTFYPMMNRDETICKLLVFRGGFVKNANYMKTLYYKTPLIKMMYDTNEEIEMMQKVPEEDEKNKVELPKWVFQENYNQEHGYFCECDECKTKWFNTWKEADDYASAYYKKHINIIKKLL